MMARADPLINIEVLDTFINERQLNKDEKIVFAKHITVTDDWGDDNYLKVITVDVSGCIKSYIKDINTYNTEWYNRYLH